MSDTHTKSLILNSTFEEIQKLEPFVKSLQNWLSLSPDIQERILLTLNEATTNAIVHGNKENPSKPVHITASLEGQDLSIKVKDEGEGFDAEDLSNPLKEENLLKEGGRGVYLIEKFADRVSFNDKGNEVTMFFELN